MAITNNTLMVLVVGVLALSVLGTTFSLKMLGQHDELPTGYAASDTGTVSLVITQSASLTLDNNDAINFGTCSVDSVNSFSYFNSSVDNTFYNNTLCDNNASLPDELIIRNDGTIEIVVTMNASTNGSEMFNSNNSAIYYQTTSPSGGCNGTMVTWSEIGGTLDDLPVCDWLRTYSQNSNAASTVEFDFAAHVALGGYNTGNTLTLTFEATAI